MVVDERRRRELYEKAEEVLGKTQADSLMSLLPPVGWADVATKQDLELLEARLKGEFNEKLNSQTKTLVSVLIGSNVSMGALAFAAARLA